MSSPLACFWCTELCSVWIVMRDYHNKVINDLKSGGKSWNTLGKDIDANAWAYSKELNQRPKSNPSGPTNKANNSGSNQKLCTMYDFFQKLGCQWEHKNLGENCLFFHIFSKCRFKDLQRRHELWECQENDPKTSLATTSSSGTASSSVGIASNINPCTNYIRQLFA